MNVHTFGKQVIPVLKNHRVAQAAVFGSYARGEAKKTSDIDLLIRFDYPASLLDLVGLKQDLEEKFNKKFDLLTYRSIHPSLRNTIIADQKIIYEKKS